MGIWWITAIGFIIILGCIGGTFVHFLRTALDKEDTKRIDPIKNQTENEN